MIDWLILFGLILSSNTIRDFIIRSHSIEHRKRQIERKAYKNSVFGQHNVPEDKIQHVWKRWAGTWRYGGLRASGGITMKPRLSAVVKRKLCDVKFWKRALPFVIIGIVSLHYVEASFGLIGIPLAAWIDGNTQAAPTSDDMDGIGTALGAVDTVALNTKSLIMQTTGGTCTSMTITAGTLTINLSTTVTGNVSCATITFNAGTGYRLESQGTFSVTTLNKGIGEVMLRATTTVPTVNYYKLTFYPRAGGQVYTINTGTLDVDNKLSLGVGDNFAFTVKCDTNNPTINLAGEVHIYDGSTWTHGTGTTTFDGTTTYTDDNATPQDLGIVSVTGTLALASGIRIQDLSGSGTLDAGGAYTIKSDGDIDTSTMTFTRQTSTLQFTKNGAQIWTVADGQSFYDIEVDATSDVTLASKVIIEGTVTGTFTYDQTATGKTVTFNDAVIAGILRIEGGALFGNHSYAPLKLIGGL